ncbi:ceramide phosphoethanolamine synthase [Sitodiplosis mosellana]|uniref:ceramide phosphoethanolamine synthase n=1 Tax=Sitodiplosis mosellana TaxID=263140 RepID=UPI002443DC20|nr:ceramide phosphoethanolamine synthase [Sitodiplosis mosellana]
MIGPSSCISKILLTAFFVLVIWYIYMDVNLYLRIQNYPIERNYHFNETVDISNDAGHLSTSTLSSAAGEPSHNIDSVSKRPITYDDVAWFSCDIDPLCHVTVKAILLDHTNHYLFAPMATIFDNIVGFSRSTFITANMISFFHVFVAILAGRMVASDSLCYRRIGVVLFQFRTFLDDLDGHVARQKKHIRGERSEIGTAGYYIDGLCDGLGCIALMIGVFVFLRNNPPRRGYTQLQAILPTTNETAKSSSETGVTYKIKVTTKKVARKIVCFSGQLLLSSTGWNRYIALYQDMLERNDVTQTQYKRQNIIMRSKWFFSIAWLWRVFNVHALLHCLLLSIFCDKLWEFLRLIQYIGFVILLVIICATEMHVLEVESFIFTTLTGNNTAL